MKRGTFPREKIITPGALLKMIKPGSRIFISGGAAAPLYTIQAITSSDRAHGLDLEIFQFSTAEDCFRNNSYGPRGYRVRTFAEPVDEGCGSIINRGDIIPARAEELPFLLESGIIEIDIAIIAVTPPDKNGVMSTGLAAELAGTVIRRAKLAVAEISRNMPYTFGSTRITEDSFHYAVISRFPIPVKKKTAVKETQKKIGERISSLVKNGSTVILPSGPMAEAAAMALTRKKDLGIITKELSDWIIPLIKSGALSLNRDHEEGGKISAGYCCGSKRLYSFINRNPVFRFFNPHELYDPERLRPESDIIRIMNVEKIDITASHILVCGDGTAPLDYKIKPGADPGISASLKNSFILALPSINNNGESSITVTPQHNIRMRTVPWNAACAVSEFGTAPLCGKSLWERAISMIEIAHPDHRDRLFSEAREAGYINDDYLYIPIKSEYPGDLECVKHLEDNSEIHIRPVRASDERMMRSFFYRCSDDSRYSRFFSSIAVMPGSAMRRYINVDYESIMSIIALIKTGHTERIIAEARYAHYPESDIYDMAFLVEEEFQGRGIGTLMARYLTGIAKNRGIYNFNASVLAGNRRIFSIIKKLNIRFNAYNEGEAIELHFRL
ncbi:MAG TPA: GNAT family N-acetyltransferase [Spirochaetota bacterium]|nr:GNAT family N-acetyltransferase [Spirochaetota bacterium]HPJ35091.1 GNAT family N-acetyltransferase [Spirochaetota bacterium]